MRDRTERNVTFNDKQSQIAERNAASRKKSRAYTPRATRARGRQKLGPEPQPHTGSVHGIERVLDMELRETIRLIKTNSLKIKKNAARTPQDEKVPGRHYTRDAGTRAAEARAGASAPHRARARDRASSEEA